MMNVNEQRDEECGDSSEAGPADLQETAETAETDTTPEASEADAAAPSRDTPEAVATSAVVDVDAVGSDSVEQPPAASPPIQTSDGDAAAVDELPSSDEVSPDAPDEAGHEAAVDPVTATEQRGHYLGTELKRVEDEVRTLLQDRDPKRKRKLTGNARWHELEDDLIALRFTGRIDEATLARIRQLIARRRYLFSQLAFVAGTRPTWTT